MSGHDIEDVLDATPEDDERLIYSVPGGNYTIFN